MYLLLISLRAVGSCGGATGWFVDFDEYFGGDVREVRGWFHCGDDSADPPEF